MRGLGDQWPRARVAARVRDTRARGAIDSVVPDAGGGSKAADQQKRWRTRLRVFLLSLSAATQTGTLYLSGIAGTSVWHGEASGLCRLGACFPSCNLGDSLH